MEQPTKHAVVTALVLLLVLPLLLCSLDSFKFMRILDNLFMDMRFKTRVHKPKTLTSKIYFVNIDAGALSMMGKEPIPMAFFAEAVTALTQIGKAKVVAFDNVFANTAYSQLVDNEKLLEDNQIFQKMVAKVPNVILGAAYEQNTKRTIGSERVPFPFIYDGYTDPLITPMPDQPTTELIGTANVNFGLLNYDANMSAGSVPRWVPMFVGTRFKVYYTLALEVFRLYHGLMQEAVQVYGDRMVAIGVNGRELLNVQLARRQLLEVNWLTPWDVLDDNAYSLGAVIAHKKAYATGDIDAKRSAERFFEKFTNAIVFISRTDPSLQSLIHTPIDATPVPVVALHANLLNMLFSGTFITHLHFGFIILIVLLLNAFVVALTMYGEHIKLSPKHLVVILALYVVLDYVLFNIWNIVLPLALPLSCMLTTGIICVTYQYMLEKRQRSRITDIFGTYLAPELVSKMVESNTGPKLGGSEREITAFFSDIQNFSNFAELLEANALVEIMNEYLTAMTEILHKEGGTLDKYIGDAIVAMFGAPIPMDNHAARACITACKMQVKQEELRQKWYKEGNKWPREVGSIRTRIGINTGKAVVGNMGSAIRFNYTMMGDNVNLAARCESSARLYGVYTMVTEDTHEAVTQRTGELVFRFLDRVVVKGKTHAVGVYEVVGLRDAVQLSTLDCIDCYEKGLKKYWERQWDAAIEYFEKAAKLEVIQPSMLAGVTTNPSMTFLNRCKQMKNHPPAADWDGTFVMETK